MNSGILTVVIFVVAEDDSNTLTFYCFFHNTERSLILQILFNSGLDQAFFVVKKFMFVIGIVLIILITLIKNTVLLNKW